MLGLTKIKIKSMLQIIPYQKRQEEGIRALIKEISEEFTEPISSSNSSSKKKIFDKYWVAENDGLVIGTIGVIKLKDKNAILKSMFVKQEYRGKKYGVSRLLLQTAIDWSKKEQINNIPLGTMTQFKAGQKFYIKNSFFIIDRTELPKDFIHNPIDDIFFQLDLS